MDLAQNSTPLIDRQLDLIQKGYPLFPLTEYTVHLFSMKHCTHMRKLTNGTQLICWVDVSRLEQDIS